MANKNIWSFGFLLSFGKLQKIKGGSSSFSSNLEREFEKPKLQFKNYFIILGILFFIFLLPNISAVCNETQININTASLEELDLLSGIGRIKAQAIIDTRPFSSVEDLINVNGIGEVTLNNIKLQGLACVSNEINNSIN